MNKLASETEGNFSFEYSPESFPGTEVDYAVEVCNAVLDVWQPKASNKAIINIPTTVENAMPHVFATQVEYIHKHLKYRDAVTLSCIHTMTVAAVSVTQSLVFLPEPTVSKELFSVMVSVPVM